MINLAISHVTPGTSRVMVISVLNKDEEIANYILHPGEQKHIVVDRQSTLVFTEALDLTDHDIL